MKGFFVKPIEKLVIEETGLTQREQLLHKAGFKPNELFIIRANIEDSKVKKLIKGALVTLDVSEEEFFKSYGEFWVSEYSPAIFDLIYDNTENTIDFLKDLFKIHASESDDKKIVVSQKLSMEISKKKSVTIHYEDEILLNIIHSIVKNLSEKFDDKAKVKITKAKSVAISY